ncbi:2-amino-4-hydroxy-6-hydroxymethyldihydropteridine diphosphokinase [Pseudomonas saliphila]|uniref:2-amino-4-hydroxy-6- hydroxymethyldihydropteridine diphosphokinase n=1 Tax=Pseudomonas saliphila TaxID=2586906 RepID=UPI00123B0122|nr:2-amino-4-hydroxy-6-hydroxymethyldihydropteridine diphosphokinase [Pseudomonas saliphila]
MPERCFIGLGSNQADPAAQIEQACDAIGQLPGVSLRARSSLYSSAPLGPQDQPSYINAVVMLDTELEAEALLDQLQAIECQQGRTRKAERWGPRTLDLDILLFGNQVIDTPRLQVPHYHMHARPFVLYPLAELNAELVMPNGSPLRDLLQACPATGIDTIADSARTYC